MVKFKIDEKEYVIPEFISIENYAKIYKVKDLFSDDYFAAKLLNILTGAPLEDLLQVDYQEVSYLANYVLSLIPTSNEIPIIIPSLVFLCAMPTSLTNCLEGCHCLCGMAERLYG